MHSILSNKKDCGALDSQCCAPRLTHCKTLFYQGLYTEDSVEVSRDGTDNATNTAPKENTVDKVTVTMMYKGCLKCLWKISIHVHYVHQNVICKILIKIWCFLRLYQNCSLIYYSVHLWTQKLLRFLKSVEVLMRSTELAFESILLKIPFGISQNKSDVFCFIIVEIIHANFVNEFWCPGVWRWGKGGIINESLFLLFLCYYFSSNHSLCGLCYKISP